MNQYAFQYGYPLSAIVGQETAKQALLMNLVNPKIGGVLLSGEKGTSKSTLVRGLGLIGKGSQVIILPLNITEDRLIGTLDLEKTLKTGVRQFEGGLLQSAHGQILYVDEVNLLSESIVNALLEVSGSGRCCVEREGMSASYPSEFCLIGTMNPEEGPLRSQWLDRFGLYVTVAGCSSPSDRKEIIRRRLRYEKDPVAFCQEWSGPTQQLSNQVLKAQQTLPLVKVFEQTYQLAVEIALTANVAGHRTELILIETAKAIAALEYRRAVNLDDIKAAAELVLPHRKREKPPGQMEAPENDALDENNEMSNQDQPPEPKTEQGAGEEQQEPELNQDATQPDSETQPELESESEPATPETQEQTSKNPPSKSEADEIYEIGRVFNVKPLQLKLRDRKSRKGEGKRLQTKTNQCKGQYIRNRVTQQTIRDFAFDATLRAAAPYQNCRDKKGLAIAIERTDFRDKVREKRTGSTILFAVDASASMGVKKRMTSVKGAILSLLTDAYQKRDRVGLIAFRKDSAEVILDITRSVDMAHKHLATLPTGGRTPLAAGIIKAYDTIQSARRREPDMVPIVVLVTDGRTNVASDGGDPYQEALRWAQIMTADGIQVIIIDSEQDFIKLELARQMAETIHCTYFRLEDLEADSLAQAVRESIA